MIGRREFITLLGGAAGWPLAARAQQPEMPVIGFLDATSAPERVWELVAFRQGLAEAGFSEGRNLTIEFRWANGQFDRLPELAVDLVRRHVSVIATPATTAAALAAKTATSTIPIVLERGATGDQEHSDRFRVGIRSGRQRARGQHDAARRQPDGVCQLPVLVRRQMARNAQGGGARHPPRAGSARARQPRAARVPAGDRDGRKSAWRRAGRGGGRDPAEIEHAVEAFAREGDGALLVLPGRPGDDNGDQIIDLAARHRLPAMYADRRLFVERGGLMSYDTDTSDLYRRAAFYVDRILKGVEPGQLPVQLPTKYDLVVNLKVAKSLGLTIPLPLLASADEVIE